MIKILYLIVRETFDKSCCVYVFIDLYLSGFYKKYVLRKP